MIHNYIYTNTHFTLYFRQRSWPWNMTVGWSLVQIPEQQQGMTVAFYTLLLVGLSIGYLTIRYVSRYVNAIHHTYMIYTTINVSFACFDFSAYIANRVTDKLTKITDKIYCCRSGSAADTQAVADIVSYHLNFQK